MRPFRELTRRPSLIRLRKLAKSALDSYNLNARLHFLQYHDTITIARIRQIPARVANRPYTLHHFVLRIHAMGNADAVTSELVWLAALDRAGLPGYHTQGRTAGDGCYPVHPERARCLPVALDGQKIQKELRPSHLIALG